MVQRDAAAVNAKARMAAAAVNGSRRINHKPTVQRRVVVISLIIFYVAVPGWTSSASSSSRGRTLRFSFCRIWIPRQRNHLDVNSASNMKIQRMRQQLNSTTCVAAEDLSLPPLYCCAGSA